jgi:hypothetical protein
MQRHTVTVFLFSVCACTGNISTKESGSASDDGAGGDSANNGGTSMVGQSEGGNGSLPAVSSAPGAWLGSRTFARIGNEEIVWSSLDLLGQADNKVLSQSLRTGMPIEALGEHGFPQAGAVGAVETGLFLEKAKLAATSVQFSTRVEGKALIACAVAPANANAETVCAQATLESLGTRAYRRPLTKDEAADLLVTFTEARKAGGSTFLTALRTAIAAVLTAPSFLYHDENLQAPAANAKVVALGDHELAARMASILWASVPDAALLAAAANQSLRTDAGMNAQIKRMLADPRSLRAYMLFFDQVLQTDDLAALPRTPPAGGAWNATVAGQLHSDLERLIKGVLLDGDGRYQSLLQQGLLSSGAVMAAQAKAGFGSAIKRGKLVRERFLCEAVPPPPPNVPNTESTNVRETFAAHSSNPSCKPCHDRMDPIGFAFANFDQVGKPMATKQDTAGQVVDLDGATLKFSDLAQLTTALINSPQVQQCMVTQWTRFALGRQVGDADVLGMKGIGAKLLEGNGDLRVLLTNIVQSTAFRQQEIAQ